MATVASLIQQADDLVIESQRTTDMQAAIDLGSRAGDLYDEAMALCSHAKTRRLYEQRPPSEGRKLVAAGRKCEDCAALLPLE